MLDPKFTEEILAAWKADESHPHRSRAKKTLAPRNALQQFIDVAFLATLRNEEGQQVRFAVALVLEEDMAVAEGLTALAPILLESAVEFNAASLIKLAGAFEPELTTIIVKWNSNNSSFSYWGLTFHAPGQNRFVELPIGIKGSANFPPDYFTVIARGRAVLTFARGGSHIGTLQAEYFVPAAPTPFTSQSLGGYFYSEVKKDPLFATYENQYWHHVRDAIALLLSEAAKRGQGGTIVLLPFGFPTSTGLYSTKYELKGTFGLQQTLEKCIENKEPFGSGIAFRKLASETIRRIANLSAVDGALIITSGFEVVTFGATLTAPNPAHWSVIGPDGYGFTHNTPFDLNRYGTRHRSAFNFAAAHKGSIVFVISQDGPVRAFHRENETTVHVWPDCTVSMFL